MLLKNFVKLIDESQTLIITDKLDVSFVFDFSKKSYKNNYWQGSRESEVITCYAREENVLIVIVSQSQTK